MMKKTRNAAMLAVATLMLFSACGKKATTDGFVDLGLPSGLLWATCNLGATSPENLGDYYAWGETSPKKSYDKSNYRYTKDGKIGPYRSVRLEASDDAATQMLGDGVCIPTEIDWNELINNTVAEWTTVNGVPGYTLTGSNGNSIFLPADGRGVWGYMGCYWSSIVSTSKEKRFVVLLDDDGNPMYDENYEVMLEEVTVGDGDMAIALKFDSKKMPYVMYNDRYEGLSIRPVLVAQK